uniref:Uncharacterized protein n=1 Tax=candidate division WOR-3 bacterium TaxID=2052148 RepID=A0A7V3ZZ15_UNCW3
MQLNGRVKEFIHTKIPRKEDIQLIKDILMNRCERVEILAKILVDYDIKYWRGFNQSSGVKHTRPFDVPFIFC